MTAQPTPDVIKDAKGKRPTFYESQGLDTAMSMIMVLANELAVVRDRLDSVERAAALRGFDLAGDIETQVLDQAALEAREAWRQDFLERLFYLARKEAKEARDADTDERYRSVIEDIAQQ